MRDLKIPLVIVTFLLVVSLGVGARSLYYEKRVADPIAALATSVPGIVAVEMTPAQNGVRDVVVELDSGARLEEVYREVEAKAEKTLGTSLGRLILVDRRTPELSDAYHQVHYALQQGIATGLYADMASVVKARLEEEGFDDHRIVVGDRHVFVQIHLSDDAYLYEALPRPSPALRESAPRTGGRLPW